VGAHASIAQERSACLGDNLPFRNEGDGLCAGDREIQSTRSLRTAEIDTNSHRSKEDKIALKRLMNDERQKVRRIGGIQQRAHVLNIVLAFEGNESFPFRGGVDHLDVQGAAIETGEDRIELVFQIRKGVVARLIGSAVLKEKI